jgi:DNA-binding NtrC family response regulator
MTSLLSSRAADHDSNTIYRVLVIDDDSLSIELVKEVLAFDNLEIYSTTEAQSALAMVTQHRPHLILLDLVMPGVHGMELLERILDIDPGVDVILMTGHYSTDSAVEAIQKGAYDYLTKPISIDRFRDKIEAWLSAAHRRQSTLKLDNELLRVCQFEGIVGHSPLMFEVFSKLQRIAPHFQTVLVLGETGTGKELAARTLHRLSPRPSGPFVVCNCAGIVETLFESELFGHVRGAFTGATQDKPGMIETANGGTLFLDEIGELPPSTQAKLLRVLQNREVQRVGAPITRHVDVRVVAATHRNLREMVAEKKFREDLYYRLSVVEIKLPGLAERKEDLPLLERHFLQMFATRYSKPGLCLTRRAQSLLMRYSWPGNVRELENVLSYAAMMAERDVIDFRDFPDAMQNKLSSTPGEDERLISLEELQSKHTLQVLDRVGGNRARAAEILGISRATLYRILGKTNAPVVRNESVATSPVDR